MFIYKCNKLNLEKNKNFIILTQRLVFKAQLGKNKGKGFNRVGSSQDFKVLQKISRYK